MTSVGETAAEDTPAYEPAPCMTAPERSSKNSDTEIDRSHKTTAKGCSSKPYTDTGAIAAEDAQMEVQDRGRQQQKIQR